MSWRYNPVTFQLEQVSSVTVNYDNETVGASLKVEIQKTANQNLSIGDIVKMDTETSCSKCDVDTESNASVVGICISNALAGSLATIQIAGVFKNAMYSTLTFNSPVFQAANGGLSINATSIVGEFWCRVGKSLGGGSILIRPEEPVEVAA